MGNPDPSVAAYSVVPPSVRTMTLFQMPSLTFFIEVTGLNLHL